MSTYDAVKDLPLEIESYDLEPLEQEVAANFTLRRTVVVLRGGGLEGRGEEVDYDPGAQSRFQARRGELPFAGPPHARLVLAPAGGPDASTGAGRSSRRRSTSRSGRPGSRSPRRSDEPQQPLRFVVSTRVAKVEQWLAARARAALQARPRPRLDGRR